MTQPVLNHRRAEVMVQAASLNSSRKCWPCAIKRKTGWTLVEVDPVGQSAPDENRPLLHSRLETVIKNVTRQMNAQGQSRTGRMAAS